MEIFLFFIAAAAVLVIFSRIRRNSERLEDLEEQVYQLKDRFAKESKKAKVAEEFSAPESALSAAKPPPPKDESIQAAKPIPDEESTEPKPDLPESKTVSGLTPPPLPQPLSEPSSPSSPKSKPEPAASSPADAEIKPLFQWRPILEKLNLWPPSGENAEATLLGWWLTRIGLVVLVIAAAFLGIWASDYIEPEIRVLGLGGIAAGVTMLGLWLERRLQAFGRLISTGGLALGYFTAFAAFALPAMKIIDDPVLGVGVQIAALAIIIGWSLWKRDQNVAAMAILLGYVSCGFSHFHDLDNLVIGGLLLLAAGGGTLLVLRRWLWTHAIATAGSWGGFLILAIGEWSQPGEVPEFSIMLGSFLLLTAILEAANCLADVRSGGAPESRPRERNLLSVFNTSAAIAAGWVATERTYPEQLATFFLAFAILLFAITAVRFWRGSASGMTETFFLKAVALLAFFFVEKFDGPTRWLSLAVEAGAVLWAYRRSGLRWVELGFGAVLIGTLGLIFNDLVIDFQHGPLFSIAGLAGAFTFILLSIELGLHSLWRSTDSNLKSFFRPGSLEIGSLIAAVAVGLTASEFCSWLTAPNPESTLPLALSILALAMAAPAFFLRRFPPVAAGTTALVWAYTMIARDFFSPPDLSEILVSAWLALIGFGIAETVFRLWKTGWHGGNAFRAGFYALGLSALAILMFGVNNRWEIAEPPGLILTGAFAALGGCALILMHRTFSSDHFSAASPVTHATCHWLLSLITGALAALVTLQFFESAPWFQNMGWLGAWLSLTGAILFAAAFWTRNAVPALAGGIPYLLGLAFYLMGFNDSSKLTDQLICAAALVGVGLGTALILHRRVDHSKVPSARIFEGILQGISLLVIHWIFRSHLAISEVFMADALLALGVTLAAFFRPFRNLPLVSSLPLALALLHAGLSSGGGAWGPEVFWWFGAAAVFGWLWLLNAPFSTAQNSALANRPLSLWHGAIAAGALALAGYHSLTNPWHLVTLAGFGILLAALWRWKVAGGLHFWSCLPAGLSVVGSLLRIDGSVPTDPTHGLIAISLSAAAIAAHGLLIAFRNPALRNTTWISGGIALGLTFLAYAPGRLGVTEITTVCWGIAAILLFVAGLIAGLRPYRMLGLIGLVFCLFRMFVFDIEDPLYRIFAFFAIAVVLLAMGYLYHRFRHLIERADNWRAESEPPA